MRHAWAFLLAGAAACAAAQHVPREIAAFVQPPSRAVAWVAVDMTGDGVPDAAVIGTNDKAFEAKVTVLIRPRGQASGALQAVDSLQLDLSPHGAPSLSVKNGVLVVDSTVGGSSVQTAATYRYRFDAEEGRMQLIGLDATRTSPEASVKMSWNLLNGTRIVKYGKRDVQVFVYGPEIKSTVRSAKVFMAESPSADELLDALVEQRPKR